MDKSCGRMPRSCHLYKRGHLPTHGVKLIPKTDVNKQNAISSMSRLNTIKTSETRQHTLASKE